MARIVREEEVLLTDPCSICSSDLSPGKFGSHYIKGEFYFDVHPPLGKMLVGLAGLLSGYDGNFDFKSGQNYPDTLHYTPWRIMMATYGVMMVPVAWYTCMGLGWKGRSAHLVTIMVLCGESLEVRDRRRGREGSSCAGERLRSANLSSLGWSL
jgi:dolichyl-phosphate-mannose--protein O-mannosyl transferase